MNKLTFPNVCLLLAVVGCAVAALPVPAPEPPHAAVRVTAVVPSHVFQRGADPLFVVAEITNNLSRPN